MMAIGGVLIAAPFFRPYATSLRHGAKMPRSGTCNFTLVSESETSPLWFIAAVKTFDGIDDRIKPHRGSADRGECA